MRRVRGLWTTVRRLRGRSQDGSRHRRWMWCCSSRDRTEIVPMHAVQCGEEGQVLSDFCFVGELRVDVHVTVALVPRAPKYFLRGLPGWFSKTAAPTVLGSSRKSL
jgi:hypothetical protein